MGYAVTLVGIALLYHEQISIVSIIKHLICIRRIYRHIIVDVEIVAPGHNMTIYRWFKSRKRALLLQARICSSVEHILVDNRNGQIGRDA